MKVLVIAAHMDDEVLGVGATIAKHVDAGDNVSVCVVCQRAYEHRFDPKINQEEKAATRRASEILGYKNIEFLDLRDELLDERLLDIIVPLEECVVRLQPDVVYTHHRGDSNQDHRAVLQASLVACRPISQHKVKKLLCYEVPSSSDIAPPFPEYAFQPNYYVDVAGFVDRKIEAMKAYVREMKRFPHPRSAKGIEILAQKRGMEMGFEAAEAFAVVRDGWS
ncbi:MAG TPA: PIG-L deacetylase family protein [Thermoanaerobaculia bacterium]|jgi:LmbE family N-acetylglucosaminyl deacetylase|nr:PIG-L deacetylase family protein [Thermoanaerobaculia bacterium]